MDHKDLYLWCVYHYWFWAEKKKTLPLDTCQKVKYDKGKGESEMTELKKKINYTVACVSEFANKHEMTQQAAFQFLYEHKAIAFLKDCYEIEHTLSFDDAIEDMERICANNGGVLA